MPKRGKSMEAEPRPMSKRVASKLALKQMAKFTKNVESTEEEEPETLEILSDDETKDEKVTEQKTRPLTAFEEYEPEVSSKKKYKVCHRKSSDGNERDILVLRSLSSGQGVLDLKTWSEELSPAQLAVQKKRQKEEEAMNKKIEHLINELGAEIVYEGDSCQVFDVDTAVSVSSVPPPTPTTSNGPGVPGYSLVVDTHSGQVVGAMTPTLVSKSLPAVTVTAVSTPPTPTPSVTVMKTRKRRTLNPPVTPQPPTKISKVVKTSKPVVASQPPVQQVKPTESNAVGGIQPNKLNKPVDVVDLTADDSTVKSSADSKEVAFNKLQGKTFPSLVVVARPNLRIPNSINMNDRSKLDQKVKAVLMYPPTKFTEWLIQLGLIRSEQTCLLHNNVNLKLGMYSDVSKFPFSGGYVWISECCPQRFVSVFSGSLFEASPNSPTILLKLIYHWACQTNVQNVIQWVKVENLFVKSLYTCLRAVCTVALYTNLTQLGGPGVKIEIGVISLGTTSQDGQQRQVKVEVLGILESESKKIRLRAVEPLNDSDRNYRRRFTKILEPLSPWVHPESIIVTDLTVDKNTLHSMGFLNVQQSSMQGGNSQIMDYLRRIVPRMFQNTLSLLSRQIIQSFLDELVWREWYGTTAAEAFDNLVAHMAQQTRADTGQSLKFRLNKVATNPFKNWTIQHYLPMNKVNNYNLVKRQRRKQQLPRSSPPPSETKLLKPVSIELPELMVPLEHYYYGTIDGVDINEKINLNISCQMCKETFTDNISIMKHYFKHVNNITTSHQCHYCLTSVALKYGLENHIEQHHPSETKLGSEYVCVICEKRFGSTYLLGKHMSLEHVPSELPYECESCTFRCSSHKQVIDHFHEVHKSQGMMQCPFCLKATQISSGSRNFIQNLHFFLQHLLKHQKKLVAKKCHRCSLWFINKEKMIAHQKKHETQRRKAGLRPWPVKNITVPKSVKDDADEDAVVDISKLDVKVPEHAVCKECNGKLKTSKHFPEVLSCTNENCQYVTCCKRAMDKHLTNCQSFKSQLPSMKLPFAMYCVCGYNDNDGNSMAKHLAVCERQSAYPSLVSAKNATVTHSMLDVLGLVRREEKLTRSSSTPSDSVSETEVDSPGGGGDSSSKENEKTERTAPGGGGAGGKATAKKANTELEGMLDKVQAKSALESVEDDVARLFDEIDSKSKD